MDHLNHIEIILRIFLAIIIGGAIGYEREMRNRPAGFITHTLVCVGACVVSLIQIHIVMDTLTLIETTPILANALKADLGRIVAQVVTGVGFLGAGTIVFDKGSVKGLTTAATIWVVACIGLGIGLGYYELSILSGGSVFFVMIVLKRFETHALERKYKLTLDIKYEASENRIKELTSYFKKHHVQIRDIEILNHEKTAEKITETCRFVLYFRILGKRDHVISKLSNQSFILSISRR